MPPTYDFDASKEFRRSTLFESPEDIKLDSKPLLDTFTQPPDFDFKALQTLSSPVQPNKCPFCAKPLPKGFTEEPPRAARAKFGFCKRHEDVEILQRGRAKGYPKKPFNEQAVARRMRKMLPELRKFDHAGEFVGAIRSRTKRGATAMATYAFAHLTLPGYYGPRGAQVITSIAMKEMEGDIKRRAGVKDVEFFGGIMGYVSSVVVPEVGVRLICEDMDLKWSEAKKVMENSVSYGGVLNPLVEESVSTDDEEEDDD
jgi:RTC4-like domain